MAKKTPMKTAKDVMSGKVTRNRVAAAEQAAVRPKSKAKAAPKAKAAGSTYRPPAKGVAARQAAIDAARKADEAAIAAMKKNKKKS